MPKPVAAFHTGPVVLRAQHCTSLTSVSSSALLSPVASASTPLHQNAAHAGHCPQPTVAVCTEVHMHCRRAPTFTRRQLASAVVASSPGSGTRQRPAAHGSAPRERIHVLWLPAAALVDGRELSLGPASDGASGGGAAVAILCGEQNIKAGSLSARAPMSVHDVCPAGGHASHFAFVPGVPPMRVLLRDDAGRYLPAAQTTHLQSCGPASASQEHFRSPFTHDDACAAEVAAVLASLNAGRQRKQARDAWPGEYQPAGQGKHRPLPSAGW